MREGASYIHVAQEIRPQKSDGRLAQIWVNANMGCFLFFGFLFVSTYHVARYRIESLLQNRCNLCNEKGKPLLVSGQGSAPSTNISSAIT